MHYLHNFYPGWWDATMTGWAGGKHVLATFISLYMPAVTGKWTEIGVFHPGMWSTMRDRGNRNLCKVGQNFPHICLQWGKFDHFLHLFLSRWVGCCAMRGKSKLVQSSSRFPLYMQIWSEKWPENDHFCPYICKLCRKSGQKWTIISPIYACSEGKVEEKWPYFCPIIAFPVQISIHFCPIIAFSISGWDRKWPRNSSLIWHSGMKNG